jgi:pimeloyl-ACP methyl ester carboxylesterase
MIELAGAPVFIRRLSRQAGTEAPPLLLHTAPTSSDDLVGLLERTGGLAPDLIGFGRSAKGGHLDYSLSGHADFLDALLDALHVEQVKLVAHGWGAGGALVLAQRRPERIERIALIDPLPLLPGFSWDRAGRTLRVPVLGELAIGAVTRRLLARHLRHGAASEDAFGDEELATVWEQFDQGTQRALLRLHRDASPERLAAAGAELERLSMPALVVWGERDPWFPVSFADRYARTLPDARVELVPGAGHWPWLARPDLLDRIARFLED